MYGLPESLSVRVRKRKVARVEVIGSRGRTGHGGGGREGAGILGRVVRRGVFGFGVTSSGVSGGGGGSVFRGLFAFCLTDFARASPFNNVLARALWCTAGLCGLWTALPALPTTDHLPRLFHFIDALPIGQNGTPCLRRYPLCTFSCSERVTPELGQAAKHIRACHTARARALQRR